MSIQNKVDFAVVFTVKNANPNGDPLNGNRPRINYDGYGEISDVCIKRKIRNVWLYKGNDILVQSNDNKIDEYKSLKSRVEGVLGKIAKGKEVELYNAACKQWIDVRSFGQVMAYSATDKKEKGVSIGIRGPVSIHAAVSINPISISSMQITKSVNSEGDENKKSSDTMGMKHRVDYGVYVFYGSISPQLAEKTSYNEEDAEKLKDALINLFYSDASSARPEGSMEVRKVFWWEHNCKTGQYSSAKVHRSLQVNVKQNVEEVKSFDDVNINIEELPELKIKIYEGN